MGKQQGLSQGLLVGTKAMESEQGTTQTQGHGNGGHLVGQHSQSRHLRELDRSHTQGHCHWGPLGGCQGQVLQGQK